MVTKFPYPKIELIGPSLQLISGEDHNLRINNFTAGRNGEFVILRRDQVESLVVLLQEWLKEDREIDIKYTAFVDRISKGLCYCPSDGQKMIHRPECHYYEEPAADWLNEPESVMSILKVEGEYRECDCNQRMDGKIVHSSFCKNKNG